MMMIDKHMGIQSSSRKTPTNTKSEVGTLLTRTQKRNTTTLKIKVFLALRLFLKGVLILVSFMFESNYTPINGKSADFIII
jgi:hypothetical protein